MAKIQKAKIHEFLIRLGFNKACSSAEAIAAARDSIHGVNYVDSPTCEGLNRMTVKSFKHVKKTPAQGDVIDDGRPCSMDEFMAALFDERADALDIKEAAEAWVEGDWKYALSYLAIVPEHWRSLPATPTPEAVK